MWENFLLKSIIYCQPGQFHVTQPYLQFLYFKSQAKPNSSLQLHLWLLFLSCRLVKRNKFQYILNIYYIHNNTLLNNSTLTLSLANSVTNYVTNSRSNISLFLSSGSIQSTNQIIRLFLRFGKSVVRVGIPDTRQLVFQIRTSSLELKRHLKEWIGPILLNI